MKNKTKEIAQIIGIIAVFVFFIYRQVERKNNGALTNLDGDIKIINKVFDNLSWSNYSFNEDLFKIKATKELKKNSSNNLNIPDTDIVAKQNIYISSSGIGPMYIIQAINYNTELNLDEEISSTMLEGSLSGRMSELSGSKLLSKVFKYNIERSTIDYTLESELNNKKVNISGKMILYPAGRLYDLEIICFETECNSKDYNTFIDSFEIINNQSFSNISNKIDNLFKCPIKMSSFQEYADNRAEVVALMLQNNPKMSQEEVLSQFAKLSEKNKCSNDVSYLNEYKKYNNQ